MGFEVCFTVLLYITNASWLINLIPSLGHPSVAVVIYNKESDKLVLVKQLRPAVLFTELMNDASITSVNDMVKANDALKSNCIYFFSHTSFRRMTCGIANALVQRVINNNFLLMIDGKVHNRNKIRDQYNYLSMDTLETVGFLSQRNLVNLNIAVHK